MIIAENLVKDYLLTEKPFDFVKAALGEKHASFRALDAISFHVEQGEVIGVVGSNGAGKSTLLKILCGVYQPTSGKVRVNGPSTAILELSTGFQPELSGRENIRRRLLLQGLHPSRIQQLEPEIIDFAELEDAIDQPVRTYSTGMGARLAFAVVTASPTEVLFIDEILAVGDEHFQGKCFKRIKALCSSGRTVVMVSHGLSYVENLCDRAIWLNKGRIQMVGDAHAVVMAYHGQDTASAELRHAKEYGVIQAATLQYGIDYHTISISVNRLQAVENLHLQVALHDNRLGMLAGLHNTAFDNRRLPAGRGMLTTQLRIPALPGLRKGLLSVALTRGHGRLPGSVIEDAWGWDNGKQVYFSVPSNSAGQSAYLTPALQWLPCT